MTDTPTTTEQHAEAIEAGLGQRPTPLPDSAPIYMRRDNEKLIAAWESLAVLRARAAAADTLADALRAVQWNGYAYIGMQPCPNCGHEPEERHAEGCIVAAALAAYDAATRINT